MGQANLSDRLARNRALRYNAFMISRLLIFILLASNLLLAQGRAPSPIRRQSSPEIEKPSDALPPLNSPSKLLKYQHEEVKKDMEKLSKLVAEVQTELDKAGENVLSLNTLRKLEDVEKLAHKIRDRIRQ